jgi:hypothetical protein
MHHVAAMHNEARHGMNGNPMLQANAFLGPWLAASRSVATAWGQAWLGPLAQQQSAAVADFNRQVLQFWTTGWVQALKVPAATRGAESRPSEAQTPTEAARAPQVEHAEMAEAVEQPAEPAEPPMPPAAAPAAKRSKPAAPLRTAAPRRKAAAPKSKPAAARSPRVTRH